MLGNTRQPRDEAVVRSQVMGNWVLAAAILGSAITFIDGSVVNVVLPVLQRELGASVDQVQWVVESYALMLAALILVGGSLGDRLGRRRVFSAGIVLFGLASVWCGLAGNIHQLIIARGVQGLGAALLVPGSLALISANFHEESRGRAIGTWSGFTSIAAGIGPVLGGWLVQRFSWRWIFFINVPLVLAVLAIAWWHVPESRDEQARGRVDWPGATLATIGLGGVVFGLIESETRGFAARVVIASLALGVVSLVGFLFAEARERDPMMPLELFRSRAFAGANLLTLFLYAALSGLFFFFPFNLIQVQGYSPAAAGAALLPFVLTMFVLSRWAGGLVARYGSKLPLVVGPLIAAAGFALFTLPGAQAGSFWTSFFPAVMVLSVGMAITVAPLTTTVMGAVDEHRAGVASGINNAVSRIAALLAIAVFGVFMFKAFESSLARGLETIPVAPEMRAQLIQHSSSLVNLKIPPGLPGEMQAAVREAIRESFVAGFRVVTYLAAALAALSALTSWLLIPGRTASQYDEQKSPA
jgi:EmrB/QacA subfamily drug resistance transporter